MQCIDVDWKEVVGIVLLCYCAAFWLDDLHTRLAGLPLSDSSLELLLYFVFPCSGLRRTAGPFYMFFLVFVKVEL
jgi:hypothetical protein